VFYYDYLLAFALAFVFAAGFGAFAVVLPAFAAGAAFVLAVERFAFDVFAAGAALVFEFAGAAGRAPLNSFGFATTFLARKFSIFASFIAIV